MKTNTLITARVSCVQKNLYTLLPCAEDGKVVLSEMIGKLKGKFYNLGLEPPVVGDYVKVFTNEYGDALIDEVLPRRTVFKRPNRSGHSEAYVKNLLEETIVSNFDYVFIVTSLNQDYSENRIARYVSITLNTGAKPVVILSKADLCDDVELKVEITKAVCDKADVVALFDKCKFNDCSHTSEPGCAVRKALEDGTLSEERWQTYLQLHTENEWGKAKMMQIAKFTREYQRNRYSGWDL